MISIIIPTLNERAHIGNLLRDIAAQDITEPYEVIIADARSTDGTRDVVEGFRDRIQNLLVVEGGTQPVGRNRGAQVASGDILFFLDADIVLGRPDFLRVCTEYFRARKLAVATTRLVPRSTHLADRAIYGTYNAYLAAARYVRAVGAMCIVARTDVFTAVGGYPEDVVMNEDMEFARQCARLGAYGILPHPVYLSVRRLEKEGRLGLVSKYVMGTLYMVFVGPIKKPLFRYEFDYTDEENGV